MSSATCTRRLQFCAGHRLLGHEGKCAMLHGHNYVALIEAAAPLDPVGRVIDFAVIKERVGGWIEEHWDHGFLAHRDDQWVVDALRAAAHVLPRGQRLFLMPYNPTAENIARYLGEEVGPQVLFDEGVAITSVTVWETENCCATWRANP